jgi:hydroxyacylglutathione hydrolase
MDEISVLPEIVIDEWSITTFVSGSTWKENCYLVRHLSTGELALIDPGADDGQIAAQIQDAGGILRHMLLTHAHHDHVGAVAALGRRFGVACRLHRNDVRLLHHAPMYAWRFAQRKIELPKPFHVLEDMPALQLGGHPIEVLHTPGHTAGSVCYAVGGAVFTGDTLLFQHVGRVDLPGSDVQLLKLSIDQLIQRLPPEATIFPGHGRLWSMQEAQQWWAGAAETGPQYTKPSAQPATVSVEPNE